ncbi:remodeling and spacing factor 1 isoform X1 [Scophthalmus maximus]|uniref:remodeling and spacing factor 1 isoform X1 n=1 Tax=Scophthalmus maximus TaxID=52904 RepID=UPI001FA84887|nr:remodeling and spacing factor 1 isoform X1 [Scophthalmus maximus]
MAASAATASSPPGLCANYAVICSFLERYGPLLDLPELTFPQLERYLRDTSSVPKLLVDLHVKLLRKIGKSVSADRWEKYLVKVCQEFNSTWAWELEEKGYKEMTVECKTGMLKYLCECQFDDNVKFKTAINEEDPDKMRLLPIGRDKDGQMYWYQLDQEDNVRVYVEEQDDLDGSSWKCIVRDRNDLAGVVALLKTQIDPELLKRDELKKEKEGEVKKADTTSDEDNKDSSKATGPVSPKTESSEKVAQEETYSEAKSSLNGVVESKSEAALCSENIGTKAQNIKEEPMEVSDTATTTAPSPSLPVKAEKAEEAKRSRAEEIQQALKNDQQAKIPLKKRGMKFSEDFEKNSSSTVQNNPSVPQVRDAPTGDATSEQTKKAPSVNDHVNGEIKPPSEKDLQSRSSESVKGAAVDKEQTTEPDVGTSVAARENHSEKEKDRKDDACGAKVTEAVTSHQADVDKTTVAMQVEKGSSAATEEKEAHESPPTPKEESPPVSKDVNNTSEKSSGQEQSEEPKENPVDTEESSPVSKTATLKETDKTLTTGESKNLNLNHKAASKEAESKDPEEKPAGDNKDSSESGQTEETKTSSKGTEDVPDVKKTQVSEKDDKEMAASEPNVEKWDDSAQKETPGVLKTTETPSAGKDPPEKPDDSENTASPSVIKKTEMLKDGGEAETPDVTNGSAVVKKADEPSVAETSEETPNVTESAASSVIKPVDKSEPCKPTEKTDEKKDTEMTPEKASAASEEPEKTEKPEDLTKTINCEDDRIREVTKTSDAASVPMEVEAGAVKSDLPKPQEQDGTERNSSVRKTTEETSDGKDKPSSPLEKMDVSEETDKTPNKDEEKESAETPKQIETEHPSSESKTDSDKGSEKDADGEKLTNDSEEHLKESKEDSTIGEPIKTDEAKEKKQAPKESEKSTKTDKSDHREANKEADAEPSTETERAGDPSKEPSTDKPTDEESKSKSEEEESATKKEVANGGEAPSHVRKAGARRRIKLPAHRRRAELQTEERQGDSESDTNTGRSLRRSPRISRPTPKAVEIHDRKMEKSQAAPPAEDDDGKAEKEKDEEEEEEEEEVVKAVQRKPREKKVDQEGQPKPKGRKRRKVRWSNTRTRRKKKSSEDEEDNSGEESSEEEEESEDDSDEDYKVERNRKRRNRNRERRSSDSSTSSDDDLPPNDDPCKHCGLPNHPELILLCDSCDNGYHTACLRPPLMIIPDGEWFCPPCQHKLLCDKLEEQLQNLDASLKKKERAERRKERLIYVGISVENIIDPSVAVEEEKPEIVIKEKKEVKRSRSWGRRSTRTKKNISYRFDEFDEAIEEAIEEDIKEAEGGGVDEGGSLSAGAGRGKDMANITGHRGKDMATIIQAEEGKENGQPPPKPSAGQRKKKRRRLNDLDSDSTADSEESEDEFRISESSEEEFVVSENESEGDTEAESDNSNGRRRTSSRRRKPAKRRRSARKRRKPRGYSDDEEDETDEDDDEDEMVTEGSSEFSDSDLDMSRRRSRRSRKKQVNYRETSESEGSQAEAKRAKMKPRHLQDSSESEASFSRDSEEESKDRRVKRRADSSEEDSRQRRRRLALKRRRASEDDDSDDSSDDSSEEDRPVRKRVNRIDSDDDDEEQEEKPKEKKAEEEEEEESKGTNPLDSNQAELPPTNGQSPVKSPEGSISRPAAAAAADLEPPKSVSATPAAAAAIAPNGVAGQEVAAQEEDEDDLLGVTDLVDYVCNNEQL